MLYAEVGCVGERGWALLPIGLTHHLVVSPAGTAGAASRQGSQGGRALGPRQATPQPRLPLGEQGQGRMPWAGATSPSFTPTKTVPA